MLGGAFRPIFFPSFLHTVSGSCQTHLWNTKQSGFLAVRQKSDGIAYSR